MDLEHRAEDNPRLIKEPLKGLCFSSNNFIDSQVYMKSHHIDDDYKFLCIDTRQCIYKEEKDFKNYCMIYRSNPTELE